MSQETGGHGYTPPPGYKPPPPNAPPTPPKPRGEPKPFPRGILAGVDYMLLNGEDVIELIRRGQDIGRLNRFFIIVSLIMGALYGAIMGATNLLQGSEMAMTGRIAMIAVTAVKVPILMILSLLFVLPPIYVSNAFAGAKLRFNRMAGTLLAATAIEAIALASMGTVAFFFALTSQSYHFIKLMHVVFFAYAGLTGLAFLVRVLRELKDEAHKSTPGILFAGWLVLYAFVGIQLAWTLRPFIGSPNEPFQVFRERKGNVFESILYSTGQVLIEEPPPGQ